MSVSVKPHDGVIGAHGGAHVRAGGIVGQNHAVILSQAGDETSEAGRQHQVQHRANEKRKSDENTNVAHSESNAY